MEQAEILSLPIEVIHHISKNTMEQADILSLPIEVLHHISKFLSVKDILACSATCYYLRHAFNDNRVWKKHLPEKLTHSLKTQELMEPEFCLQETFTPLCENRITYMKKINIVNNWKNSTFVRHSTKTQYWYDHGVRDIPKTVGQVIYKDRYLFLGRFKNDVESDAVEVWDINSEPICLMELKMDELYYEHIYIVGDCLVVVECVQVKVYEIKITEKSLPHLFSFLITDDKVVFDEPINHPWRHDMRCVGWRFSMVDHYLFANKCDDEPYACGFHVWDIANACKVGEFFPPIMGFAITYHSHIGSTWFLQMIKQSDNMSYLLQFDIKNKSFSETIFKFEKSIIHSIVFDSHLILFEVPEFDSHERHELPCSVYDLLSTEKIKDRLLSNVQDCWKISSTKVINGHFVMLCKDAFHVIDALTLETLQQFPCEGLRLITHQFVIHGTVLILAANTRNIFEVWDLKKKEKTPKNIHECYTGHLYLNESCTKLAYVGKDYEIVVYHFL